ncbi:hypothetical protein L1987_85857 [Smallanthus sonchifolius]|uniref:Uncharacterized protein n=1 Tax=Smallanthus sonchifolius TaxID=185202 RepID=A0ACB8XX09_9ASTR|nr:hypothetical protein L1987_85857 [Smallanthus sonchifolius]
MTRIFLVASGQKLCTLPENKVLPDTTQLKEDLEKSLVNLQFTDEDTQLEEWKKYFHYLSLWEGQDIPYQTIAVLKIKCVPFLLRDKNTFDKIGEAYGKTVLPSEFSWDDDDNSFACCYVLTDVGDELSWEKVRNVETLNLNLAETKIYVSKNDDRVLPNNSCVQSENASAINEYPENNYSGNHGDVNTSVVVPGSH